MFKPIPAGPLALTFIASSIHGLVFVFFVWSMRYGLERGRITPKTSRAIKGVELPVRYATLSLIGIGTGLAGPGPYLVPVWVLLMTSLFLLALTLRTVVDAVREFLRYVRGKGTAEGAAWLPYAHSASLALVTVLLDAFYALVAFGPMNPYL